VDEKYYIDKDVYLFDTCKGYLCKVAGELVIRGNDQVRQVNSPLGESPALTTMMGGYRQPKVVVDREKALCLTATYYKGASVQDYFEKHRRQIIFEVGESSVRARKLTPLECERLQTFPDGYTELGLFGGKVKRLSDTQRYRLLGNAFTVDVVAWIFSNLKEGVGGS